MSRSLCTWIKIKRRRIEVRKRTTELFLYIIKKFEDRKWDSVEEADQFFHFIAWHCDLESYRNFGESITGANWIKGEKYPLPVFPREKRAGKGKQP